MSPSVWTVKSPLSSKNGGTEMLALRIAKRTTLPSAAVNLMAMLVLPTDMVWFTALPVVLICSSTSPPRDGTPGSPVERSTLTRIWPAMPSGPKMKPPCPSNRPTPSTLTVTSEAAMRMAFGAGIASPGFGSTSVTCSKLKLPLRTNGSETEASSNVTRRSRKPARRRDGPFASERTLVLPRLSMTKVSLTAAFVVLIWTAMSPLIPRVAPPPWTTRL